MKCIHSASAGRRNGRSDLMGIVRPADRGWRYETMPRPTSPRRNECVGLHGVHVLPSKDAGIRTLVMLDEQGELILFTESAVFLRFYDYEIDPNGRDLHSQRRGPSKVVVYDPTWRLDPGNSLLRSNPMDQQRSFQ
ncbi:hypothetical protein EYF80_025746 [Liparis tanakae]|uniref:Uncharacterized protein n=1 Tax=Liparis tanakae TaxID=230148 RepID=A0A4Z2HGD4_9TELE|nr:hypothetical protein EYF80_025746 [Liparis tanakae]